MGLFDRLFGGTKVQGATPSGPITGELTMKIVNAYGSAMADGPVPGTVADVKSLPYPKAQIKEALRNAMSVATDKQMREQLVQAYIFLADYQEGVGAKPIGIDSLNASHGGDLRARAAEIVAQGAAYEKWKPLVEAEIKASFAELKRLGLMDGL